jgi:hypothetical protein
MPSKTTSPYATTFKSAIKRGTPCSVAVNNIANRTKKSTTVVYNSLFKAGLCYRQKFNGQWVYFACNSGKSNATVTKTCQLNMWQCFVDWCIASGNCTPEQLNKFSSQNDFMNFCKKFFSKQFTTMTKSNKTSVKNSSKSTSRVSKPKSKVRKNKNTAPKSFKFPTVKSRTSGRRVRKAA